ncbi:6-O-methylguanine DNA methyltransferase [Suillus lakei]|nr:6-O-methylguanine DNA methyltransferase [Suillus lakei]
MPAVRTRLRSTKGSINVHKTMISRALMVGEEMQDLADCKMHYLLSKTERKTRPTARQAACIETAQDYSWYSQRVTPHQRAVYDFTRTIPCGCVTTYKEICIALGQGSPRSVGSALRKNPFAPFVPCHRIITSNLYISGFFGEWGTGTNARGRQQNTGVQCNRKMEMLEKEGVCSLWKGISGTNLYSGSGEAELASLAVIYGDTSLLLGITTSRIAFEQISEYVTEDLMSNVIEVTHTNVTLCPD